MKAISRVLIALVAAIAALFTSTGTSNAGLDNELSLVDGQGRTLTIQQWDTFLNGVFPLDRNRLTREWFHSGRAKYIVAGEDADDFEGTLEALGQDPFLAVQHLHLDPAPDPLLTALSQLLGLFGQFKSEEALTTGIRRYFAKNPPLARVRTA